MSDQPSTLEQRGRDLFDRTAHTGRLDFTQADWRVLQTTEGQRGFAQRRAEVIRRNAMRMMDYLEGDR